VTDEVLQIEQRLLPLFDRHFFAVVRPPPIVAIAALVIAALDDLAVDRDRHGDIAAGAQIDFLGHDVANVMAAEPRQFQKLHNRPPETNPPFKRKLLPGVDTRRKRFPI